MTDYPGIAAEDRAGTGFGADFLNRPFTPPWASPPDGLAVTIAEDGTALKRHNLAKRATVARCCLPRRKARDTHGDLQCRVAFRKARAEGVSAAVVRRSVRAISRPRGWSARLVIEAECACPHVAGSAPQSRRIVTGPAFWPANTAAFPCCYWQSTKPKLDRSLSLMTCRAGGIHPVIVFPERRRTSRLVRLANSTGMVLTSVLESRTSSSRLVSCPNSVGMPPVSWLELRCRIRRLARPPSSV